MDFKHISVMLEETIESLHIKEDGIYVDCTLGGGGHSSEILSKLSSKGKLIGIDQDKDALSAAKERLKDYSNVIYVHDNFHNIDNILKNLNISSVDGVLIDLGVSSYQLDNAQRGFSYMKDAPLDMRMNGESDFSAYNVVNEYSEEKLCKIMWEYGEERFAKRITSFIIDKRQIKPITTTGELVEIIYSAIPAKFKKDGSHPAKKTFQAIRIEVNNELNIINKTIEDSIKNLNQGGVISIITFHSLEDRLVKNKFKELENPCICPKDFPICNCNRKPSIKILTKKPIEASKEELECNKRSKSAKLRYAVKL